MTFFCTICYIFFAVFCYKSIEIWTYDSLEPHIERLLREQQLGLPAAKRILELNSDHAVMKSLRKLLIADSSEDTVASLIEVLYDQALIAEGSPVDDPTKFAQQLTDLVTGAAGAALAGD